MVSHHWWPNFAESRTRLLRQVLSYSQTNETNGPRLRSLRSLRPKWKNLIRIKIFCLGRFIHKFRCRVNKRCVYKHRSPRALAHTGKSFFLCKFPLITNGFSKLIIFGSSWDFWNFIQKVPTSDCQLLVCLISFNLDYSKGSLSERQNCRFCTLWMRCAPEPGTSLLI